VSNVSVPRCTSSASHILSITVRRTQTSLVPRTHFRMPSIVVACASTSLECIVRCGGKTCQFVDLSAACNSLFTSISNFIQDSRRACLVHEPSSQFYFLQSSGGECRVCVRATGSNSFVPETSYFDSSSRFNDSAKIL